MPMTAMALPATSCPCGAMPEAFGWGTLWAHINVPPPAPPGPYTPQPEQPITVPTPEPLPPEIDEPAPEPLQPIREPGIIRPPQAAGAEALHSQRPRYLN